MDRSRDKLRGKGDQAHHHPIVWCYDMRDHEEDWMRLMVVYDNMQAELTAALINGHAARAVELQQGMRRVREQINRSRRLMHL